MTNPTGRHGKKRCAGKPSPKAVVKLSAQDRANLRRLDQLQAEWGWAVLAHDHHMDIHRGAWEIVDEADERRTDYVVVFGNDSFDEDVRSQKQVALLVGQLDRYGIKILRFEQYQGTWAMGVRHRNGNLLGLFVWDAWFRACGEGFNPVVPLLKQALQKLQMRPRKAA